MKYEEFMDLMDTVKDYIHAIDDIDRKLESLHIEEKGKNINTNFITINGKDYYVQHYRLKNSDSYSEFSKFIYDSLVSYFETEREKLYKQYKDKMTELKSIIEEDKIIDFTDEIKCLEI